MGVQVGGTRTIVLAVLAVACMLGTPGLAAAQGTRTEKTIVERTIADSGPGYRLHVAYPQLGIGTADAEVEQWVQSLVDEFGAAVRGRQPDEQPYGADLSYKIVRNDDAVTSLLFTYSMYLGGAHPNQVQTAFNYLGPDGLRVYLPDVLGDDGVRRVSELAIADLTTRPDRLAGMLEPSLVQQGAGPAADNFETFELRPDRIVVHFDPYVVAAYAAGPQEVQIPNARLEGFWRPDPRAPLPSFDCAQASTSVEHAICADARLAQLDRRVGEAFARRARWEAVLSSNRPVVAEQVSWLDQRDAACADQADAALIACLAAQYDARLAALKRY